MDGASNPANHSQPASSINCTVSRGLDGSNGEDSGCSKATTVDDNSCSEVSDKPIAPEIERGSTYEKTVLGESSRNVSEQSPCFDVTVKDPADSEETRHFISKENSSSDALQRSVDPSPYHLEIKSSISPDLIKLLAPYPAELAWTQIVAWWAENEWRKSVGWPMRGDV